MPNSRLSRCRSCKNDHLHRNVERGGGFVEHQKVGFDRNGAGDADAGALPAGKLMREARQKFERQPALARHLAYPLRQRLAADFAQPAQRIGDGVKGGEARVDAFARVLEHHLNAGAVGIAGKDARRLARQLAGAELDLAVADVDQPGQRPHQGRLAAPGFAHKADGLTLIDGKAHVIDGVHLREDFQGRRKTAA